MVFQREAKTFQEERLAAAAGCLVPLSTILEETIAYTKVFSSSFDIFSYLIDILVTLSAIMEETIAFTKVQHCTMWLST